MLALQVCAIRTGICHYSMKIQYEANLKHTSYLFHSIRMLKKVPCNIFSAFAENAQKCCFLLAACPHFLQVLALALPSIKTTIIQRKRHWDSQNKTFHMRRSRPVCMSFRSPPARPLTVYPAQSKSWAADHSSRKLVRMSS